MPRDYTRPSGSAWYDFRRVMKLSEYFDRAAVARDGEFAGLDEADSQLPRALVFCQQLDYLRTAAGNAHVSCIIAKPELARDAGDKALALAADPRLAFFRLYRRLFDEGRLQPQMSFGVGSGVQIHPSAVVSKRSRIGDGVSIGAGAVIEDHSQIGDGTVIGPRVVIGAEGLLTVWNEKREPLVVPHAGGVTIGRGVVILAGSVVAKALFRSPTEIADFCQVGILTNIGHGVRLGARCVVSGNCIIAGRVRVGAGAWVGASSSIAQGLSIGEGAQVHIGSVVVRDVAANEAVSGNFARAHAGHVRSFLKGRRS
jgi:UDP-3-O-[3-hydroxymyristoyl] glucosamine N-acyltransferase